MREHWTEERLKAGLDGTFIKVDKHSGEYHEMIVPKTFLPPYDAEDPPKKTGPQKVKKVKLTPIAEAKT